MTTNHSHRSTLHRRYALTAVLCLIGAVALYNWVISPHVGYLHAMRRLEPVLGRMAEELEAAEETRDEKRSTMWGLQGELAKFREGLFTREECTAFTHDLPILVGNAGCTVSEVDLNCARDAIETDDPNTSAAIEVLNVDCTVVGQYEQIVALLQSLRAGRQRVWVDSCQIDLLDPRSGRLKCQLGLTVYIGLQPGELH